MLADLVLVLHFAFILFVTAGGLLVLRWPRAAFVHLPAAAWGVLIELRGWICPLTPLENTLRRAAGRAGYEIGCTASPGSVGAASEPLLLRRLDVRASRPAALCFEIERALAEEEPAESFAR